VPKRQKPPEQGTRGSASKADEFSLVEWARAHGGDINKAMARVTAERARQGDTRSAIEILHDFVAVVDQNAELTWTGPIPWDYAKYIADAFEKVVRAAMQSPSWSGAKWEDAATGEAQCDANLALGIKSSKAGRRKGAKTYDTAALAALYWFLVRRGLKPELANRRICEQIGCDRKTVQNASQQDGNAAYRNPKLVDDESLKVTFAPYAMHAAAIIRQEQQRLHSARRRHKTRK
jgi:hypothetical protein